MSLERRQPLRRTPIARTKQRKPIPSRSAKREEIAQERREFVDWALRRRPWCQACGILSGLGNVPRPRGQAREAVDVHELVRRSQGAAIVPSQGIGDDDWLALCRPCHDWVTTHPEAAVALGLARWGSRPNL